MKNTTSIISTSMIFFLVVNLGLYAQPTREMKMDMRLMTFNVAYQFMPKLEAKAKTMKEAYYNATEKNGKIVKGELLTEDELYSYDEKGKIIMRETLDPNGKTMSRWAYTYDEKGNETHQTYQSFDEESDKSIADYEFTYNANGKWTGEKQITLGKQAYNISIEYDLQGNWTVTDYYNMTGYSGGSIYALATYPDANTVEIEMGEAKGLYLEKLVYKYDTKGNVLEFIRYDLLDGSEYQKRAYAYDANNRMIEKKQYSKGALYETETFMYDQAGNLIEEYSVDADNYKSGTKYKYNEQKLVVEELGYYTGDPNKIYTYKYTMDTHNNWTQKILLVEGKVSTVTDRVITYW